MGALAGCSVGHGAKRPLEFRKIKLVGITDLPRNLKSEAEGSLIYASPKAGSVKSRAPSAEFTDASVAAFTVSDVAIACMHHRGCGNVVQNDKVQTGVIRP